MQHDDFSLLISRELDGELSDVERRSLHDHLQSCGSCDELRRQLRVVQGVMREDRAGPRSVGLAERVLARVERERHADQRPVVLEAARFLWLRRSAAAAAIVLLALGGVHVASLPDEARAVDPEPVAVPVAPDFQVEESYLQVISERGLPERDGEAENLEYLELFLPREER